MSLTTGKTDACLALEDINHVFYGIKGFGFSMYRFAYLQCKSLYAGATLTFSCCHLEIGTLGTATVKCPYSDYCY